MVNNYWSTGVFWSQKEEGAVLVKLLGLKDLSLYHLFMCLFTKCLTPTMLDPLKKGSLTAANNS